MSEFGYTVLGFGVGLGLLALYAIRLWWGHRIAARRLSGAREDTPSAAG